MVSAEILQTWKSIISLMSSTEHSLHKFRTLKNHLGDTKETCVHERGRESTTCVSPLCLNRDVRINTANFHPHGHSCWGTCQWCLCSAGVGPEESPCVHTLETLLSCVFTHLLFGVFSTLITAALAHLCSNSHLRITPPNPSWDWDYFHWICQLKKNVSIKLGDYRLIN